MTIRETLNERAHDGNIASKLLILADEVTEQATEHLKLINDQLPEFDIHDISHSYKIIENMEGLMTEKVISQLSIYELFLLYMSGILHDCAMALPTWELRILMTTEGQEGFTNNKFKKSLANDCKMPFKFSEALEFIKINKEYLYGNYEGIKSFIFAFQNEDDLQRDLAERLIDYQQFRNGYTEQLNSKAEQGGMPEYLELSDLIRYDFTRSTHTKRVEKYIRNLSVYFTNRLGGAWGEALAKDLAQICRSHGEPMVFVKELEEKAGYFGGEYANLQFIAVMLRLGDVLHFSHDRAPKSLYAEKMIHSKESLLHWKVKFQGINYTLDEVDSNGQIKIQYMAYCDEPGLYYFIHEYLDLVNAELQGYFNLYRGMEYSVKIGHLAEKYKLQIAGEVDRTQIRHNEDKFIPVGNLKFTLNQAKILELLMGVGLYKNKFLCLRELYQNSLDACRCMISCRGGSERGNIEFGLGNSIENNKKYLYCLDNGIGMTKDTIATYLLKIGNSFYKSKDFQRLNAAWGSTFKPTSQFGIGILSCFMIGDKLEITTKALTDDERNGEVVRFSIDGPHEHFYYMKPDKLDLERIGQHGSIVKLFLSDETVIYNDEIDQLDLIIHGNDKKPYRDKYNETYKKWDNHIYKLLYNSVAIPNEVVDIQVRMSSGRAEKFTSWLTPFDVTKYDSKEVKLLYSDYRYMSDGYNPIEDFLKIRSFIETKSLSVNTEDIEYNFLLSLPLPGMPVADYRILSFELVMYKENSVLVDGVPAGSNNLKAEFNEQRDLMHNGTINFIGVERPVLSVDRNSIVKLSDKLEKQLANLPDLVAKKILETAQEHIKKYNISADSTEINIMWNYIFKKFNSISKSLVSSLVSNRDADMILTDISLFFDGNLSTHTFVQLDNIEFKKVDMRTLSPTEELIMFGKLFNADSIEVFNTDLQIKSTSFCQFNIDRRYPDNNYIPIAIMADKWTGDYEEYDMVSALWPIVSKNLYSRLLGDYEVVEISVRTKTVGEYSNSLSGLASLDPVLIHPKMGMFSKADRNYWKKQNWVGRFENSANNFYLFELNNHSITVFENKQDFFLYAYISPKVLSNEEQIALQDYRDEDPEYYEGVNSGWSILLLGNTAKFVILPGMHKRNDLVSRIKPAFWEENKDICYSFTDGTSVLPVHCEIHPENSEI